MPTPTRRAIRICTFAAACGWALVASAVTGRAQQPRTPVEGVYAATQAQRGEQTYQARCTTCHGPTLAGVVGPPLAGDGFLGAWSARSLAELVDKIQKTMPPQEQGSLSRDQAIELTAYLLRGSKFASGPAALTDAALAQVVFPDARRAPAAAAGVTFITASNLAQLMRGVTFPNANILFNVQVKDPAESKPALPVPFDYVGWGATVYYGWQAVDQAALALVDTAPLFLLPGRRCENGRPVPVDRADWKQFTQALVDAGQALYRASQTRNMDTVAKMAEQLNDTCANCHKVYRDSAQEGASSGANRCR